MSISQKTIKGAIWQTSVKALISILKIVAIVILARLLNPLDFGIFQATTTGLLIIFSVVSTGLGGAIIQKKNIEQGHLNAAFWSYITIGILSSLLIYITANYLSIFFNTPELSVIYKYVAFTPLIISLGSLSNNLLQKDLRFKAASLNEAYSYLFAYLPTTIILAYNKYGYWALIIGFVSQTTLETLLNVISRPIRPTLNFSIPHFKELLRFSIYNSLARLFGLLGNQVDTIIISRSLGPIALGNYNRAYSLVTSNVNLAAEVIDKVFFSAFSHKQDDKKSLINSFYNIDFLINLIFIPLTLFCFFSSKEIISIFLGNKWIGIDIIFKILSIGFLFRVNHKTINQILRATGHIKLSTFINLSYFLLSTLFMIVLKTYGIKGIAIGFTLGFVTQYIILIYYFNKIFEDFSLMKLYKNNLRFGLLILAYSLLFAAKVQFNIVIANNIISILINLILISLLTILILDTSKIKEIIIRIKGNNKLILN